MDEHYFSADPSVAFRRVPVVADVWGHELALTSGSGVFAQGRLDVGTAVLFRETEPPTARRYLDLGCGYGVIGLALATAVAEAVVRAVDVNERAVLLANENAASLGVGDRFAAVTPEQVPADEVYDEIWSNPPIRVGKEALHELLLTLAAAAGAGRPGRARGRQEPRRRLAAALAGGAGLADGAALQREGLPGARGAAAVSTVEEGSQPGVHRLARRPRPAEPQAST